MANKLWLFGIIISYVYAQSSVHESLTLVSKDPVTAFINELQQNVSDKKSDILTHIKSFRQQHTELLRQLSSDIEITRTFYTVELEKLTENVNRFISANENDRDVSNCTMTFYAKIYDANLKLDDLNINLTDANSTLKKISKQIGTLGKQIGSYKKVMKTCKFQPLVDDVTEFSTPSANTCAADYLSAIDLKVGDAKGSINNAFLSARTSVRQVIESVENEIRYIISEATEQFLACVK
ncbi:hypothetical protein Trydic_g9740 [Trypoxylus dichotomus]